MAIKIIWEIYIKLLKKAPFLVEKAKSGYQSLRPHRINLIPGSSLKNLKLQNPGKRTSLFQCFFTIFSSSIGDSFVLKIEQRCYRFAA